MVQNSSRVNQADIKNPVETKRCVDCCALLPVQEFGLNKSSPDGYRVMCKRCRNEETIRRWYKNKEVNNARTYKKYQIPKMQRCVRHHNLKILRQVLPQLTLYSATVKLVAFSYITKLDYSIVLGQDKGSGLKSFSVFSSDGSLYWSLVFSGKEEAVVDTIADMVLRLDLRLELDEVDAHESKTLIYYL